jgi:OOP family OmpA-OmpF porin
MADGAVGGGRERPPSDDLERRATEDADDRSFASLRTLLVGPERQEIRELEAQVTDPAGWVDRVTTALPDAVARKADDPALGRALGPLVEEAITASVRRDPQPLADALYPAIGPAIRKAIAHALGAMMESMTRAVEHSVSWRAVQWRWAALRTGKPFAEIVLLNTLQYRVEQIFLIHRETGLLLQQVAANVHQAQDADQVSAMLTAIGDFVRDSFRVGADEGLDVLRVGELTVIIEQGPDAILAGVVRGTVPPAVRASFQDALETIHRRYGGEIAAFRGDATPLERARSILEHCLVSEYRERQRAVPYRRWLIAGAVVLVALGIWAAFGLRDRLRWNDYLDRLRAEPGIVVLAGSRRGSTFVVEGLRDPLGADPATFVTASGLDPGRVEGHWEVFHAVHPRFVVERARQFLRPPDGVTFTFSEGVLSVVGDAPERWRAESQRLALALTGVRRFTSPGPPVGAGLEDRIERTSVLFPKGSATMTAGGEAEARAVLSSIQALEDLLRLSGGRARLEITGHTDEDGDESANVSLSTARATAVLDLVRLLRLEAIDVTSKGVASTMPVTRSTGEREQQRNRRVAFTVQLLDGSPSEAGRP